MADTYRDIDTTTWSAPHDHNYQDMAGSGSYSFQTLDIAINTHNVFGHSIIFRDGTIECMDCDMEEDIPEIIRSGSGEREALYKMYLFSKFLEVRCIPESPHSDPVDDIFPDTTPPAVPPSIRDVDPIWQDVKRSNTIQ